LRGVNNWTSRGLFQFHSGCDPADGYVGLFVVVNPYLRAYASVSEARASIGRYIGFYNNLHPHSSLGGKTPDQAYLNALTSIPAAA